MESAWATDGIFWPDTSYVFRTRVRTRAGARKKLMNS